MANLTIVTIDLETYWSQTHSLSKMSPILYCTHPDTEVISIAVKVGTHPTDVLFGEDNIERALNKIDWSDKFVIGHNLSGFDALLLAWRFGVKPAMWGCTLAMARPHFAKTVGLSLGKLVEHFGIGEKDQGILLQTKGRRLADFTPEEIDAMRTYNKADTEQCFALFNKLVPMTPKKEMKLIDSTIRMLVEPRFEVDVPLLERTLAEERARMRQVLIDTAAHLHVGGDMEDEVVENVRAALASAPKFSAVLRSFGVDVPMKPSPTNPEKQVPALAKTDEGLLALREHDDPRVAAVVEARLDTKSTILETRIQSFLDAASACNGRLPVPINYYGADTTGRDSGFLYNPQNLPRVLPSAPKPSDALRNSLRAPKGYKVVVSDLSGIELRVNLFLWKVPYAMELFTADPEKADLYKALASDVLNVPYDEVQKMQRQAGKAMHLGCIAEGEMVLTDAGLVPIEKVSCYHRVWDGVEWVRHEGAVFQGVKEVIQYDSLTATPDHIVYLRDGTSCRFDRAASENLEIAVTGNGRQAVRSCADNFYASGAAEESSHDLCAMHLLPHGETDRHRFCPPRGEQRVSEVQPTAAHTEMAGQPDYGNEAAMHQPERRWVRQLWRAWDRISVCVRSFRRALDSGKFGFAQEPDTGPDRQRRTLRAGKPAVGYAPSADNEPTGYDIRRQNILRGSDQPSGSSIRQHDVAAFVQTTDDRRDRGQVAQPTVLQTKRRVWDILNAGPRHRFTVNGRLVSNCGFGLGNPSKFVGVAKQMAQITVTGDEAKDYIAGYRVKHPEVVSGWRSCHTALGYIAAGEEVAIDPWGHCVTGKDYIRTPGGFIRYPNLRQEVKDGKVGWVYGDGRHKTYIYGGKVDENLVQHLARNIVMDNSITIHKATGFWPALRVHDELVYVVPEDVAEQHLTTVLGIMRTPPAWWPELAVWSEGDIADDYGSAK